ncbi:uncharacterized protein BO88DRAFT_439189 [Aspergillus vadensis CBS 113365]|uniref:Uncharacterized protein n=1 Tax=Aspergillus vadensis (strain CBS 113365 / IMI 142717 / IBT 24658) TaxID=1448311 RepID=A0A319AU69_ASPVC|nr:hypothetical protein BO88DRAFT_439189 [Aspergillus vadensis CBS 113365]PYH63789.1 hypothetical protein BO88DRAFT_439189 [Aspergillus vadensis CBS 113365]
MSLDLAKWELPGDSPSQQVPVVLLLAAALLGLLLAVYTHAYVFATLIATQTPNPRLNSSLSRRHFRGLSIFVFHRLAKIYVISMFPMKEFSPLKCGLLSFTAELLLSYLRVANVLTILRQHSKTLPHSRYIPTWSMWSKAFTSILLYSTASSICFYLPTYLIQLAGSLNERLGVSETVQFISLLGTIVVLYFGMVVPTYAIFIRVTASAQRGESMTIRGAWQGFPWSSRVHFFKLLGEVLFLEAGVTVVLVLSVLGLCHPTVHDDVFQLFVKYFG